MGIAQSKLADAFELHKKGDFTAAERQYRALLRPAPNHPDLLYLMGMLCLDTGRAGMSAGFFDRAIRAAAAQGRKIDPEWRLALGAAWQRDGKHEAALAAFDEVLADNPKSIDGLFCKATTLQDLERPGDAVEIYRALLDIEPRHAEAAGNMGIALRDTKRPENAILALRKAVLLKPDYADAWRALAFVLNDSIWAEDAVEAFRRAVELLPEDIELCTALSAALARTNRVEEAEAILAPLVDRFPGDPLLASQRALARLYNGDHAGATKYAKRALAIDPRLPAAHLSLALAERHSGDEKRIADMEGLLAHGDIKPDGLAYLHFALAGRYGTLENHRRSFEHYMAGNAAKRDFLADRGAGYDRQADDKAVDRIIANNPREVFTGPPGSDSALPVFIIGMPRSGTTLSEQILASHPQIGGGGELSDIGNAVRRLRETQGYPENPPGETALQRIAAHYLKRLREVDSGALRVTDKLPGNYRNLGLIGRLFPNAQVIHCRRNPIDNCLSCFLQDFGAAGLSWSFDLGDLVHQYKSYRRLMDHWREVFPGRFLEIDYEQIVADQEGQSRRLIAFTGLGWDDSCLRFHETKRAVVTASHSQVRQPIYNTSVGRWKRYGDALAPLVDGLAEFLDGPEAAEG